jgi:hypothetical protein
MELSDQTLHKAIVLERMSIKVLKVDVHCSCLLLDNSFSLSLIKIKGLIVLDSLLQVCIYLANVALVVRLIGCQLEVKKEVLEVFLHNGVHL